jgi:hypothetical protein
MLASFSVGNFRSFGEEVTLNMIAHNRLDDHPNHCEPVPGTGGKKLLRTAVIYGANAAGKSNLVRAMRIAQRAIVGGEQQFPPIEQFRFDAALLQKPCSFEFRFLLKDRIFIYGFDISTEKIEAEWLSVLAGHDEIDVFTRNADGSAELYDSAASYLPNDPLTFQTLAVLIKIPLKKRQLLLNRAASLPVSSQGSFLSSIIKWLTEDLVILGTDSRSGDILDRIESDDRFRKFSGMFLNSVGTGISDLRVIETKRAATDWERQYLAEFMNAGQTPEFMGWGSDEDSDSRIDPKDPSQIIMRILVARHECQQCQGALAFSDESDGTRQLLHFLPIIYPPPDRSKVVVIDELDKSLHPLLCWEFIRFFAEACPGAYRQLIVTTHEAHLLNQELLRRDEYWFVEKDKAQQSRLVSLSEFKIRKDLQMQKGYLQGRFGAIPIIGGMDALERLLECGNK